MAFKKKSSSASTQKSDGAFSKSDFTIKGVGDAVYTPDFPDNTNFNISVPYGTSSTVTAWVSATFSPVSAISSVDISDVILVNGDANWSSVGTNQGAFPITLINTGGSSQVVYVSATFDNTAVHASDIIDDTLGFQYWFDTASLAAGVTGDTLGQPGSAAYITSNAFVGSLTAVGDAAAPSGISAFTATPGQTRVKLTWTTPLDSDLSATRVQYALGIVAPSAYTEGTTLYSATADSGVIVSTQHTGLTGGQPMAYSVWAVDDVNKWSSISAATTATATPFATSIYGTNAFPYLTDAQIRAIFVNEGII